MSLGGLERILRGNIGYLKEKALEALSESKVWEKIESISKAKMLIDSIYSYLVLYKVPKPELRGLIVPMWQFSKKPVVRLEEIAKLPKKKVESIVARAPLIQLGTRCNGSIIIDVDLERELNLEERVDLALRFVPLAAELKRIGLRTCVYPTWRGVHIFVATRGCCRLRDALEREAYVFKFKTGTVISELSQEELIELSFRNGEETYVVDNILVNVVRPTISTIAGLLEDQNARIVVWEWYTKYLVNNYIRSKKSEEAAILGRFNIDSFVELLRKIDIEEKEELDIKARIEVKADYNYLIKYPPSEMFVDFVDGVPFVWNGTLALLGVGDEKFKVTVWPATKYKILEKYIRTSVGVRQEVENILLKTLYKMALLGFINSILYAENNVQRERLSDLSMQTPFDLYYMEILKVLRTRVDGSLIEWLGENVECGIDVEKQCVTTIKGMGVRGDGETELVELGVAEYARDPSRMTLFEVVETAFRKGMLCLYHLFKKNVREGERFFTLAAAFHFIGSKMLVVDDLDIQDFCSRVCRIWNQEKWLKECVTLLRGFTERTVEGVRVYKGYGWHKHTPKLKYLPCLKCKYAPSCFSRLAREFAMARGVSVWFDTKDCRKEETVYGQVEVCRLRVEDSRNGEAEERFLDRLRFYSIAIFLNIMAQIEAERMMPKLKEVFGFGDI